MAPAENRSEGGVQGQSVAAAEMGGPFVNSRNEPRKEAWTVRKLALLIAAGSLWLFLAAIPALADGGPHIASVNSGTSTLTADSCAGCHRAHSAQGEYLLAAADDEALCLSCHGTSVAGATVDVENGVQYKPRTDVGHIGERPLPPTAGVELGALRDGGFLNARIGASNPSRLTYPRGYNDSPFNTVFAVSTKPKVPVGAEEPVTSAHVDLGAATPGVADTGIAWGSGVQADGVGQASVTLTCVECHNPHGNGAYRILRPVPGTETTPLGTAIPVAVKATYANTNYVVTGTQHKLVVNDTVTLTGVGGNTGTYYVNSVVNGFTFTVASTIGASGNVAMTNTTATGTVTRPQVLVTDSPVDPDNNGSNPTKNYTVLQTKGVQGVNSTFLLYARDVVAAAGGTGVAQNQPSVTVTAIISTGTPAVSYLQTGAVASGVAAGDVVAIAGVTGVTDGDYTVGALRSSGSTLYNQFSLVGQSPAAGASGGTVIRKAIAGTYTAAGGDYFRRTVPWNAALVNPACSNSVYTTANSAYCATMNDAPNGIPAAITAGTGKPSALNGQQAFVDQMSSWCAACHNRYYQNSNENIGNAAVISELNNIGIGQTTAAGGIKAVEYTAGNAFGVPSFGDRVTFAGTGTALDTNPSGGWYVTSSSSGTFTVSATQGGAAVTLSNQGPSTYPATFGTYTKVYQSSNSGWGYPRYDGASLDPTYKYQHSTASNRACTVCHVGHGSNAVMPGTFSGNMSYPPNANGTASTAVVGGSRLLKVDNRGTCQMCHDPTGTVPVNTLLPTVGGNTQVP
jgi:predicted CXXCH cytochrome family protein